MTTIIRDGRARTALIGEGVSGQQAAQDKAAEAWVELMWHYIEAENLDQHAWTEVGGVQVDAQRDARRPRILWEPIPCRPSSTLDGKIDTRDPDGMPVSTYMIRMAKVEVPFGQKVGRRRNRPRRLLIGSTRRFSPSRLQSDADPVDLVPPWSDARSGHGTSRGWR